MRNIYFVRHGQPENGRHCCGGNAASGLDPIGLCQAQRLGRHFKTKTLAAVYTSPLPRCIQTAQVISGGEIPMWEEPELREMDTGLWEGLTFVEIKSRYPAEYAARGQHMGTVAPPGGESFRDAGARLGRCVMRLLDETHGDIAVVGHGGAGRAWLCGVMGVPLDDIFTIRQPWGGITALTVGPAGLTVRHLGLQPGGVPADIEIEAFLEKMNTPAPIRAHGRAVAERALALAEMKPQVDQGLLRAACLLHDMVRPEGAGHAARAAKLLDGAGWTALADIVARHHDLGASPSMEAKLLYLADKLTLGESTVTLDARFAKSREKCKDTQALAAWKKRYDDTIEIFKELQRVTP